LNADNSLREVTLRKLEDIQKSFKERDLLMKDFEDIKPMVEKMFTFVRAKLE
jgi:hypothetical protein